MSTYAWPDVKKFGLNITHGRDEPIIGTIGIGISKSVFLGESVSVCYSNVKTGIGKVKTCKYRL